MNEVRRLLALNVHNNTLSYHMHQLYWFLINESNIWHQLFYAKWAICIACDREYGDKWDETQNAHHIRNSSKSIPLTHVCMSAHFTLLTVADFDYSV